MAIDTPARHIYTGNGNQRVFPIPTKIIGDDYIRIEIDSVYQSDRTKWDIVNNSVIFITAPLNGVTIDIQVATSEEALSVLGSSTAMDIVAESITNVNTVSTNIAHVTNVSHNITEMTTVSNNVSSVVITANDSDEINILASIHTQLESLYADRNKITSLYNDKTTLDSIYSDKAKLDAIFNDLAAIEDLYSIKVKLESIYADKSKLESIYADKTKLDSIYADKTQIDTLYNNISNIMTVYTNIASVIAVSNNIASVNTTADNIVDINTFSNRYKVSSTQPSSAIAGDLWYDTIATVLKYYTGSFYVAVSPDITLLLTNTKFISNISIGNTTLSGWTNSFNVIEAPGGTFFASNGVATLTGSNCYYDGVNWKYKVDGTAGLQLVNQGTHTFRTAASGTAGSNITWVTIATISDTATTLPSNTSIGNVSATELQYLDGVTSNIQNQLDSKNPNLVSGTNIKTINGSTILESGNINLVDLTTNQTISGIKTFSISPIVPTPTTGTQAATKQYVDNLSASLSPVIISGQVGNQSGVQAGKIHFEEIWVNTGGISYNSTTRRFTVPKSGTYRITMNPFKIESASAARVLVGINTDTPTAATHKGHTYANGAVYSTMNINSVVNLLANDYIVFFVMDGQLYNDSSDKFNQFTIERIA